MKRNGRSRASIAVRVGVLALLAVIGATVAYRHIADATSQGPIPADKQARLDRDRATRGHGRAPKVADPNDLRPTSGPVAYETGIIADDESPMREFVVRNRWGGTVQGRRYIVFAGARTSDPTQGVVLVQEVTSAGDSSAPRPYDTPGRTGAVQVVSLQGSRLTLATDAGARVVFNMATLRFE